MRNRISLLFLAIAFSFLQGCILVPFIDSAKQSGFVKSDRQRLLQEQVVKFSRVRFWGKPMHTLAFAKDENRKELQDFIRAHSKHEKIVESEVEFVDFSEDAYSADVSAKVKYYRIPYYVVRERIESQKWTFSVADGWQITNVQIEKIL